MTLIPALALAAAMSTCAYAVLTHRDRNREVVGISARASGGRAGVPVSRSTSTMPFLDGLAGVGSIITRCFRKKALPLVGNNATQVRAATLRNARVGGVLLLISATAPMSLSTGLSGVLAGLAAAVAGYYLPTLLASVTKQRLARQIRRELPDAMELILLGVRAGVSFERVLRLYCSRFDNALAAIFNHTLEGCDLGLSRREALAATRLEVDDEVFSIWAEAVERSERLGSPLSKALGDQAVAIRKAHNDWVEEMSAKAPVKMLFPLVALIMPALFVILLGPVLIKMVQGQF